MATPRSLRSFFDSTPPELLDTALPSLLLLSRATHEQAQAEIAALRSQLAEKEAALSAMFIRQHGGGGGGGGGGGSGSSSSSSSNDSANNDAKLGASISFGVHEAQLEALERKNEDLADQNRKYALAVGTSEAKGRALMAEIKNMRDRWQSPAAAAAREENERKHRELEAKYRATAAELEARKAEIGSLVEEKAIVIARMRVLESGSQQQQQQQRMERGAAEDADGWAENDKLLARLRAYQTGNASLNKTISVLKTVVKTNEQSNVDLQKKNLDLIAEINTLESQYEGTQKKNIVLESKNSELEDDNAALEVRLGNLGGDDHNGNSAFEARIKELAASNQHLEAKINELVDTRRSLEAKNKQLSDNNKHLTDTNIKLLDSRKAAESKTQQHQEDKARLEASLRKADKSSTAQRIELEDANKKLIEDKSYLARKHERQSQKIQDLENEVSALQERSSRVMSEIHTLRNDKSRLEQHLDSFIRQEKNKRRLSVENRERPEFPPYVKNELQINSNAPPNGHKGHESSASPVVGSRGTKRSADDRDDPSPSVASNGRNYTIRSIAENAPVTPHPLPSPVHAITSTTIITTNSNTNSNPSPPPYPQARSLFDRVKPPAPETRSLFDRIVAPATPSPPSRPQLDRELDELIAASAADRRGVFCRFHGFQPKVAELLSLVCGGPLESVRMALEKDIAFLWFLRPRDAAAFMAYARGSVNGGKITLPHPRGEPPTGLEFVWNEKPVRALERDMATHVVRYGASRVFVIHFVPYEKSLQQLVADVGGKRIGFWLCEGEGGKVGKDGVTKGREVVVEFTNVRDAVEARKRIGSDWWGDASWVKEGCDRAVPSTG